MYNLEKELDYILLGHVDACDLDKVLNTLNQFHFNDNTAMKYRTYCLAFYVQTKEFFIKCPEFEWGVRHSNRLCFHYDKGELTKFMKVCLKYLNN